VLNQLFLLTNKYLHFQYIGIESRKYNNMYQTNINLKFLKVHMFMTNFEF